MHVLYKQIIAMFKRIYTRKEKKS